MIYIGLTKNVKIKHEIKLFLRNNLNDGNERLWAFIITVIYCGPMLLTVFAVSDKLLSLDSILIQILLGIIGFIVCLFLNFYGSAIVTHVLFVYFFIKRKEEKNDFTGSKYQQNI
jgi:K+-sensing histidine kinase KdpD